ncbi:hypothetical protein PoB_003821900 [Plakobranchus ocellatus]|uniref:Helix-turn-helix domain-containing protein n=1 Tax=Plakobranchus ocellatus TaxID=259542 RepID=A0AAV4B036_9GAST|nr:hypothetical protein PoB_003821900 [Plakobranchus ocellatus]
MFSFDICDFYPSISLELLNRSLDYAAMFTHMSSEDRHIIKHTKKITLYKKGEAWRKLASDFDVTMGSFDGAETCELVGLYLLSQLKNLNINVGLYRDGGLAVTTQSAREAESTKKKICKIFKDNGLNITIEANKKAVDFLDISFDLRTGTYKPHKKPNTNISYMNKESNHPPSIKRNLAKAIAIRLLNNSSNAEIFHQEAEKYQEALIDL